MTFASPRMKPGPRSRRPGSFVSVSTPTSLRLRQSGSSETRGGFHSGTVVKKSSCKLYNLQWCDEFLVQGHNRIVVAYVVLPEVDGTRRGIGNHLEAVNTRERGCVDSRDLVHIAALQESVLLSMNSIAFAQTSAMRTQSTAARSIEAVGCSRRRTIITAADEMIITIHKNAADSTATTGTTQGEDMSYLHEGLVLRRAVHRESPAAWWNS